MTVLSAFHGSVEAREAAIAQLMAHDAAGEIFPTAPLWQGEHGSPVGCLLHDTDPQVWEARLGLPAALAPAIDVIVGYAGQRVGAAGKLRDWLRSIEAGADLDGVATALLIWVLDDARYGLRTMTDDPQLLRALTAIVALHERSRTEPVDKAQWRKVRSDALQATDAAGEGPEARIGKAIEAAAWNVVTATTALADTVVEWINICGARATAQVGWIPQDDAALYQLSETFAAEAAATGQDPATIDYMGLLTARQPELFARMEAARMADQSGTATAANAALDQLTALTRAVAPTA